MGAPYKRGYKHTGGKGRESKVNCDFCGRQVPKWKTFVTFKGFRLNDPTLKKQIDPRFTSMFSRKMHACPACARHRGIVKVGRSRKTRKAGQ